MAYRVNTRYFPFYRVLYATTYHMNYKNYKKFSTLTYIYYCNMNVRKGDSTVLKIVHIYRILSPTTFNEKESNKAANAE